MPIPAHREEIEIKLPVHDVAALRARLRRLRARKISPRTHESNTLYDTPRQDLRRHGQLIRIRIEQPPSAYKRNRPNDSATTILTYKGPPHADRNARNAGANSNPRTHFKTNQEAEVSLTAPAEMARILSGLGLHTMFRYEKFRTTYALPGLPSLKIELDETPVGTYLELEGPPAAIDRAAHLLGYAPKDYMTDTYGSLYLAACRREGRKPGDMLFPPTKKSH